jgi:hypothetical protein
MKTRLQTLSSTPLCNLQETRTKRDRQSSEIQLGLPSLPPDVDPILSLPTLTMSAAVAKAPALPPDQSFIAFEFSPEPEEALQPSTTGPNNASSSSTTTTAANGGVGSKAAQKRSRDERDKEEREALDNDDPRAYRNKKEQQRAEGGRRDTPWVNGIDWE